MNQFFNFCRIPARHFSSAHLCLLVVCALGLAAQERDEVAVWEGTTVKRSDPIPQ